MAESFLRLVARMRQAQRDFFKHRRHASPDRYRALLIAATDLEAEVDRAIAEAMAALPLFDREDASP